MHGLIQGWIAQWQTVRDRLRRPEREADAWWLDIRERILRFLLTRYIDNAPDASDPPRPEPDARFRNAVPIDQRGTYCRVTPEDHPPRTRGDLGGRLRSVSRINASKRPRWRLL